jgi:predicted ATPase
MSGTLRSVNSNGRPYSWVASRRRCGLTIIALSGLEAMAISPYLASLLSIPIEGRYPALEMAPSEMKERTIAALIALFVGLTESTPALALLEDAHWIDPTSLDVFGRLVERLQGLRGLLVVTFRPEFAAPWVGRSHVTAHWLNRFGRRQAAAMIDRVAGRRGAASGGWSRSKPRPPACRWSSRN